DEAVPVEKTAARRDQQVNGLEQSGGTVPEVGEALIDSAVGRESGEIPVQLGDGQCQDRIPVVAVLLAVEQEERCGEQMLMDPSGPVVGDSAQPPPIAATQVRIEQPGTGFTAHPLAQT